MPCRDLSTTKALICAHARCEGNKCALCVFAEAHEHICQDVTAKIPAETMRQLSRAFAQRFCGVWTRYELGIKERGHWRRPLQKWERYPHRYAFNLWRMAEAHICYDLRDVLIECRFTDQALYEEAGNSTVSYADHVAEILETAESRMDFLGTVWPINLFVKNTVIRRVRAYRRRAWHDAQRELSNQRSL